MKEDIKEKLYENEMLNNLPINCEDGWFNILDILAKRINFILKKSKSKTMIEVLQVKEKFGSLRFYYNLKNNNYKGYSILKAEVSSTVAMAEEISRRTCEICGSPGTSTKTGWLKIRCSDCHKKD